MLEQEQPQDELEAGLREHAELHDHRTATRLDDLEQESAERIAGWLGIAPDGVLTYRVSPWLGRILLVLGVGMAVMMLVAHSGGAIFSSMQLVLLGGAMAVSADTIRADVQGLSIRKGTRRQQVAWNQLRSAEGSGRVIVVRTDTGEFRLSDTVRGGKPLLRCIRQVIAARAAGMILPGEVPLPEGALSKAEVGEAAAQAVRGLSRSEL